MAKSKVDCSSLKKGQVVIVYWPSGKVMPGEYLVEDTDFDCRRSGRGGMDEGSPDTVRFTDRPRGVGFVRYVARLVPTWGVTLRRLNLDGTYTSRIRSFTTEYSHWTGEDFVYKFERTGKKMKQLWVAAK